jgi:hypothetical protein
LVHEKKRDERLSRRGRYAVGHRRGLIGVRACSPLTSSRSNLFRAKRLQMRDNGNMDNDQVTSEQPEEGQPAQEPQGENATAAPRAQDPRRRLRELLAVPERERSDAAWDEIIELEIQLAPGNRATSQSPQGGRQPDSVRNSDPGRRLGSMPQQDRAFGGQPGKRFSKQQSKHRSGRRPRPAR